MSILNKNPKNTIVLKMLAPIMIFGLLGSLTAALPGCRDKAKEKVTLDFWNVYDDSDVFKPLLTDFKNLYPNVTINYYKKSPYTYEAELVDALAAGRGPDILAIHNTWLPKHIDKISPISGESMTIKELKDNFVDVVSQDFVASLKDKKGKALPQRIYALPMFVDTLALYWNKDMLNSAGIAEPPKDWSEFVEDVRKLTIKDESGAIFQSGATLGTFKNINRATDILCLLMLQTGARMTDTNNQSATFNSSVSLDGKSYYPGADALRFYTDFASPSNRVYTWNAKMDYSVDAFTKGGEGKSAMMINYAYNLPTVKAKDPHLRFAIAPVPQPKDTQKIVNYANYWGLGVSASSSDIEKEFSWIFIKWLSEKTQAQKYLTLAKRPTSRRDLVDWQKNDLELGVFAEQSLQAKSWYQADNLAIETILGEAIESVNNGKASASQAISRAAEQVTVLMRK